MGHRNARLTFHGRRLLVQRVREQHMPVAHVAKAMGVSRQCAHRWVARFDAEGVAGLEDRSSRPHRMPTMTSPEVEANAALLGPAVGQWLLDACTHEHDIRQALGQPGAHESAAVALGYEWGTDRLVGTLDGAGAPGLALRTEAGTKDLGGEPHTGVQTSRFEIVRAMTGRRSRAQVEAYGWDGPPRPEHLVLAIFTLRADDFVE